MRFSEHHLLIEGDGGGGNFCTRVEFYDVFTACTRPLYRRVTKPGPGRASGVGAIGHHSPVRVRGASVTRGDRPRVEFELMAVARTGAPGTSAVRARRAHAHSTLRDPDRGSI